MSCQGPVIASLASSRKKPSSPSEHPIFAAHYTVLIHFISTRVIEEIKAGRLPEWYCRRFKESIQTDGSFRENLDAPAIAKDYWRLSPDAKMLDMIYAVRSDETTHR